MANLDQIEQFNNGTIFPENYSETYIATKHIANKAMEIPDNVLDKLKEKIEEKSLYFGNDSVLVDIITGLIKGNIILQGPPGTGKTTLAKIICEVFNVAYDEATAISDWTTYDTIGGLQPDVDTAGHETLIGKNGCIVDSILNCCNAVVQKEHYEGKVQANWLILDELNRCEIDKVFGELFTAFGNDSLESQKSVRLWFEREENKKRIYIPNCYRIIGAMNNIDKNFVYDISQGLTRRFTFIEILPPEEEFLDNEMTNAKKQAQKRVAEKLKSAGSDFFASLDDNTSFGAAERELKEIVRHIRYIRNEDASFLGLQIGTAQIIDAYESLFISLFMCTNDISTLKREDVVAVIDSIVASRIIPQMDGFDYIKLNEFYSSISEKPEFANWMKVRRAIHKLIV